MTQKNNPPTPPGETYKNTQNKDVRKRKKGRPLLGWGGFKTLKLTRVHFRVILGASKTFVKLLLMLKSLAILQGEKTMPFYGSIELRALNGKTTVKRWKLNQTGSDGAAFVAAKAKIDAIATALQAITNAVAQDVAVSFVTESYAAGAGDITEQALINVWAEDTANAGDVLAISQVYVPAPVVGIFLDTSGSGYDIVDRTDANLQTFIDALAAGAFISDNETIDTGAAVNGIENGRRVTRKSS